VIDIGLLFGCCGRLRRRGVEKSLLFIGEPVLFPVTFN
jgi:hypothetical protein